MSLVYKAEVSTMDGVKEYLGQASNTFKFRYNGHTDSFRNVKKRKETTLSNHIWKLKEGEVEHEVSWSIAALARPYTKETKRCQLCNMEKTLIARQDTSIALNRRSELMTRCRHRDKYLLTNWVTEHPQQHVDTMEQDDPIDDQAEASPAVGTAPVEVVPQVEAAAQVEDAALAQAATPLQATSPEEAASAPIETTSAAATEVPGGVIQDDSDEVGGPMTRSRTRAKNKLHLENI